MKESEAIKELHGIRPRGGIIPQKRAEALDVAIKALEEVQQYRAIGTPEECRAAMEKQNVNRELESHDEKHILEYCISLMQEVVNEFAELIDADALKEYCIRASKSDDDFRRVSLATLASVIDVQPAAYDVDKVVEQLEAYSNADEAERLGTMPVVELADAIKIVKGGGVE